MRVTHTIVSLSLLLSLALSACSPTTSPSTPAATPTTTLTTTQPASTPAQATPPTPVAPTSNNTPITQAPKVPAIEGKITFRDGMVGSNVKVLLREEGTDSKIITRTVTDSQGYYRFFNINSGTYWISVVTNNSYITNRPDAIALVSDNTTFKVQDIKTLKDLFVLSINDVKVNVAPSTNMRLQGLCNKFTWTRVEGAAYYTVSLFEWGTPGSDSLKLNSQTNSITWPQDISKLSTNPSSYYSVYITAYTNSDVQISDGIQYFTFNP